MGVEPMTRCLQNICSTTELQRQLFNGAGGGSRTHMPESAEF